MQEDHQKDLHAAALGQRGGQKRMAQLSAQERSALSRYAARARWHPREAKAERERAREIITRPCRLLYTRRYEKSTACSSPER